MQCPLCNYFMGDLDAECDRCHGKGLQKATTPLPDSPAKTQHLPPTGTTVLDDSPVSPTHSVWNSPPPQINSPPATLSPSSQSAPQHTVSSILTVLGITVVAALGLAWMVNSSNNDYDEDGNRIVKQAPKTDTEIRAEYEEDIRSGLNRRLAERGATYTCTEVSLVKESDRKYSGFARFSDGDSVRAEVLIDEDGRTIWRTGR